MPESESWKSKLKLALHPNPCRKGRKLVARKSGFDYGAIATLRSEAAEVSGELQTAMHEGNGEAIIKLQKRESELPYRVNAAQLQKTIIVSTLAAIRIQNATIRRDDAQAAAEETAIALKAAEDAHNERMAIVATHIQTIRHNENIQRQQALTARELREQLARLSQPGRAIFWQWKETQPALERTA